MKVLITGSTGLLGQALSHQLAKSAELVGISRHAPALSLPVRHMVCDLSDSGQVTVLFKREGPFDAVIHTQAMSDVDRCELEPGLADAQNVQTTRYLTQGLQGSTAWFIHVSTDYVFDGRAKVPYDESSPVNPISAYGRSKVAAEQVALGYGRGIVIRPSTLFGPARNSFCDAIVSAFKEKRTIQAFKDQSTSPTYAVDCAEAIALLLQRLWGGSLAASQRIYHITNSGFCTRVAFAQRVANLVGYSDSLIQPITMADSGRPAPRPAFSALTSKVLSQAIGRRMRSWDEAVKAYLIQRRWTA